MLRPKFSNPLKVMIKLICIKFEIRNFQFILFKKINFNKIINKKC